MKRDRAIQQKRKKLFDQPIYALFDPADPIRSTSQPPERESENRNVEQPSVLKHFTRRRIADRYPDEWID